MASQITKDNERCRDCGACCFEQGSPPGYLMLINRLRRGESTDDWPDPDDVKRLKGLPIEAEAAIKLYSEKLMAGAVDGDGPCCWLGIDNRCRWYAYRPSICRELTPGSDGCQCWRDEYNVDVAALQSPKT